MTLVPILADKSVWKALTIKTRPINENNELIEQYRRIPKLHMFALV